MKTQKKDLVRRPLSNDEIEDLVEGVGEDVYLVLCDLAREYAWNVFDVDLDDESRKRGDWRLEWEQICVGVAAWITSAAQEC